MSSEKLICKKCNGEVLPVVYGLPLEEDMENQNIILGGCIIEQDSPKYVCKDCGERFDKQSSRNSLEELLQSLADFRAEVVEDEEKYQKEIDEAASTLIKRYSNYNLTFDTYGGFVPFQAEGNVNEKFFYFRFRYDTARLMVGDYVDDKYLPENAVTFTIENATGEPLNGFLSAEEFIELFSKLVEEYLGTTQ